MYTVTKTAKIVGLSRSRFYQLIKSGFFPKPIRIKSAMPYYSLGLFLICKNCKETGIGVNGVVQVFYDTGI